MVALSAFVPNPFLIGEAMAQATAQDTMNITAKVVNPMDISQKVKLNFGQFAVGSAASAKINFPAAGGPTVALGDAVLITGEINGKVSFNAPANATFTISVTELAAGIKLSNAGTTDAKTVKVDTLYLDPTLNMTIAAGTASVTMNAANTSTTAKITGGGTLGSALIGGRLIDIDATQTIGTYLGSYTMQVTL